MNSSQAVSYYTQLTPFLTNLNNSLNYWLPFVVLMPGWVLNLFTASVFMRKKFWKNTSSMGYYYSLRPLFSNLTLSATIITTLTTNYYKNLALISYGMCVFWFGLRLGAAFGAQYFGVQMTVDQAINIIYPRRFQFLSKTRNLVLITVVLYLLIFAYAMTMQIFRTFSYRSVTQKNVTTLVPSACAFTLIPLAVNNILFCIIRTSGFIINFVANVVIIKRIIASKANLNQGTFRLSSREYSFMFSLMWSNILQFLLTVSFTIVQFIQLTYALDPKPPADMSNFYSLVYSITFWGNSVYESLHFWINLTTNKLFKQELRKMILFIPTSGITVSRLDSSTVNPNRTSIK